jgi:hypothetical protein
LAVDPVDGTLNYVIALLLSPIARVCLSYSIYTTHLNVVGSVPNERQYVHGCP